MGTSNANQTVVVGRIHETVVLLMAFVSATSIIIPPTPRP